MKTHYDVLGVPPDADAETIKAAYRRALKEHHPDLHDGDDIKEAHSKAIIDAYNFLKDADRRSLYDARLKLGRQQRRRLFLITLLGTAAVAVLVSLGALYLALAPDNRMAGGGSAPADVPDDAGPVLPPRLAAAPPEAAAVPSAPAPSAPARTPSAPAPATPPEPAAPPDEPLPAPAAPAEKSPPEAPAPSLVSRATAWGEILASGDPRRVWDFLQAHPGTPEAALAMGWLERMIDTTEDTALLQAMRARVTGPIAQRVATRMAELEAPPTAPALPAPPVASRPATLPAPPASGPTASTGDADADLALIGLDEAIRLDPNNAERRLQRAAAWIARGAPERALVDFSAAIGLDPKNVAAYHQRGLLWQRLGDADNALADLDQAIRLTFSDPWIYCDRGIIWQERGHLDRAIADFDRAIRLDPLFARAHFQRGLALEAKGDKAGASASLAEAARLDPVLARRTAQP